MSMCVKCSEKITSQGMKKALKCCGDEKNCGKIIHIACIEQQEKNADGTWRCSDCDEPSIRDVMKGIRKLFKDNKDIIESLNSCHEKIEESNKFMKEQAQKIQECFSEIEILKTKCAVLEKENANMKVKLNNQQQNSRLNSVEIYGIPEQREENPLSVVAQVCRAINVPYDKNYIDTCYRITRKQKTTEPRGIFLKFTSRIIKEEFMQARKVNRTLCLQDLNIQWHSRFDPKRPVYINESLTGENKLLFAKCREYKKKFGAKYLWVKNGKILMRKSESGNVYVIENESNLNDVH